MADRKQAIRMGTRQHDFNQQGESNLEAKRGDIQAYLDQAYFDQAYLDQAYFAQALPQRPLKLMTFQQGNDKLL